MAKAVKNKADKNKADKGKADKGRSVTAIAKVKGDKSKTGKVKDDAGKGAKGKDKGKGKGKSKSKVTSGKAEGSKEKNSKSKSGKTKSSKDKGRLPDVEQLPSTLQRSDAKARRTFAETRESAVEQYGEGEAAHRVAFAALKHTHEKVGDHWEPKEEFGPSDARAEGGAGTDNIDNDTPTAGGVDANATKAHLYGVARRLEVSGRSSMSKGELVDAIQKANARATREASRS